MEPEEIPSLDAADAMREMMEKHSEAPPEKQETPPVEPEKQETPPSEPPVEKEEPTEVPEPPAEPPEDPYDKEIDAVQPPERASDKTKESIAFLKEKAKQEHRAAVEAQRKAQEIEKAKQEFEKSIEGKILTPEQQKQVDDLRNFYETFGIENDPSITQPFDQRAQEASSQTENVLKAIAVPEPTIKYIQENGGLYKFRMSNNPMPPNVKNDDGSRMTQAQFYKKYIEPNTTDAQKEELSDAYGEIRKAEREKTQKINSLKTNREQFVQKRQESVKAAQEDWVKRVDTHSKKVLESYGEDAKLLEVPPNAAPEEKARIEKHNADYKRAESEAIKVMQQVTPENLVEAAIAKGYVPILQDRLKERDATIASITKERDEIQKKYDKIKKSGKTTDLRGTLDGTVAKGKKPANAEEAMTQLLNQS